MFTRPLEAEVHGIRVTTVKKIHVHRLINFARSFPSTSSAKGKEWALVVPENCLSQHTGWEILNDADSQRVD